MKQILLLAFTALVYTACTNSNAGTVQLQAAAPVLADRQPAECPYLTHDHLGNTVLGWVRMVTDSTTAFCYATSTDGKTFGRPVVVPNSANIQPHGENLPKIIFKPNGDIIALWGSKSQSSTNKYAGLVSYTQSFDGGRTWTAVQPLVRDTAGHDQRYYDVAILPNGEAGIIWLDNRKTTTKEGSALYFAATRGNEGFGAGRAISQPCCPCCRTDLFVDQKGGIHALFRGIVQDSIRDMVHIASTDAGATFTEPRRISEDNWVINGCPHTGPAMTENNQGLHFAWFTGGKNKGCYYTRTADKGQTFAAKDSVSTLGSHPQLATLPGGQLLLAWDESHLTGKEAVKQVGVQLRSAEGRPLWKQYLPTGASSSYPVVSAAGNQTAVVAYTAQKGDQHFVQYQTISLVPPGK